MYDRCAIFTNPLPLMKVHPEPRAAPFFWALSGGFLIGHWSAFFSACFAAIFFGFRSGFLLGPCFFFGPGVDFDLGLNKGTGPLLWGGGRAFISPLAVHPKHHLFLSLPGDKIYSGGGEKWRKYVRHFPPLMGGGEGKEWRSQSSLHWDMVAWYADFTPILRIHTAFNTPKFYRNRFVAF